MQSLLSVYDFYSGIGFSLLCRFPYPRPLSNNRPCQPIWGPKPGPRISAILIFAGLTPAGLVGFYRIFPTGPIIEGLPGVVNPEALFLLLSRKS